MQSAASRVILTAAAAFGLTSPGFGQYAYGPFDVRATGRTYGPGNYPYTQRSRSKKYPEQSTRQALRGMRRQQGGPGLPAGAIGLLGE